MAGAVVILVSMSAVIGFMVQRITHEELQRSYQARIDFVSRQVTDSCQWILNGNLDLDLLGRTLNSAVQGDGVVSCAAFDATGKLMNYARVLGYGGSGDHSLDGFRVRRDDTLATLGTPHGRVEYIRTSVTVPEDQFQAGPGRPLQRVTDEAGRQRALVGYVVLAHTRAPVERTFAAVNKRIWTVMVGVGALAGLLSWLGTRSVIRPVYDLIRGTERIAAGDLVTRVQVATRDELSMLADSFNSMTDELRESRRRLDDHNRILERTVLKRTQKLREAYEELKVLDSMKDGFLSSISHEFRTPITSIQAFAEILQSEPRPDEETSSEFLQIIGAEAGRLEALVDSILDLVRIENGEMPFRFAMIAAATPLQRAMEGTKERAARRGIDLRVDGSAPLPDVLWDCDKITRVLQELISNALNFAPSGSAVTLRASEHGDGVRFSVRDLGAGIPESHLETVFQKFRQVGDTLTDKPMGIGVGLPICREIVRHHGGEIHAELPTDGPGTRFVVDLPLRPPDELLGGLAGSGSDGSAIAHRMVPSL